VLPTHKSIGTPSLVYPGGIRIVPRSLVNTDYTGHDSIGHLGQKTNHSPVIEDLDPVVLLDVPGHGVGRVEPNGMRLQLSKPGNIMGLGMNSLPGMSGYQL
jgi:hypothetical protein